MKISFKSNGFKSLSGLTDKLSLATALQQIKTSMLQHVKRKLTQETFTTKAQKTLAESISIEVKGETLVVTPKAAAWVPYVGGQKPGQMAWLAKARAPIPIVTDSGRVIFRSATPKSMKDGKWMHPGRAPFTLLERASHEARQFLNGHLYKMFQEQLRKAFH
jgi:hypothetical protein